MAERISEIYSLLVPLLDGRLIIPRSCVAEVVGFRNHHVLLMPLAWISRFVFAPNMLPPEIFVNEVKWASDDTPSSCPIGGRLGGR